MPREQLLRLRVSSTSVYGTWEEIPGLLVSHKVHNLTIQRNQTGTMAHSDFSSGCLYYRPNYSASCYSNHPNSYHSDYYCYSTSSSAKVCCHSYLHSKHRYSVHCNGH